MTFDPAQFTVTKAGRVLIGQIRGNKAYLEVALSDPSRDPNLELVIFYLGSNPEYVPLDIARKGVDIFMSTVPFDVSRVVEGMVVTMLDGDARFRLESNPKKVHYHRLLSRNLREVSANLRKQGRINDLDTRYFAARNSIKGNPKNFIVRARCVVAYAYSGLEQERDEMINDAYSFIIENSSTIVSTHDLLVQTSMLTLWAHLAVWRQQGKDLFRIYEIMKDSLVELEEFPRATYNTMSLILLIGGFLMFTGHFKEARNLLSMGDLCLRVAANGYLNPEFLMTYREFIRIAECAYLCQLGLQMIDGVKFHSSLDSLTPEMAWNNSNRFFRGDRNKIYPMQEAGREKYLLLINNNRVHP